MSACKKTALEGNGCSAVCCNLSSFWICYKIFSSVSLWALWLFTLLTGLFTCVELSFVRLKIVRYFRITVFCRWLFLTVNIMTVCHYSSPISLFPENTCISVFRAQKYGYSRKRGSLEMSSLQDENKYWTLLGDCDGQMCLNQRWSRPKTSYPRWYFVWVLLVNANKIPWSISRSIPEFHLC